MERRFSKRHCEMAVGTDRRREIDRPDGYGKNIGNCGDTIEIFLVADRERLKAVYFNTDGCLDTVACGNTVAELAVGRRIEDAWKIKPKHVIDYLQTLPADHHHCAELVVGAMYRALTDLNSAKEKPWMTLYRNHR